MDAGEIKGHGLIGIAVAPLSKADVFGGPDAVYFYCDNMQAYHLAVDYMVPRSPSDQ